MYFNARFFGIFIIFVLSVYFSWEGVLAIKNRIIRKPFGWRNELLEGKKVMVIGILFLLLAALSWWIVFRFFYCITHNC